jgi:hypothetical protein
VSSKFSVPNGYTLFETESIAVIATGLKRKSANVKTGAMVQVWILNRADSPVISVKNGSDQNVCFDCVHRGTDGFKDRTCYVNVAQGPNAVWKAYRAGNYPFLPIDRYAEVFQGRTVRLGAYGEPVLIPMPIIEALTSASKGWTGYTHQWRNPQFQSYRAYVMASCDRVQDSIDAKSMGWRHFRVRTSAQELLPGEIMCPASEESGKRTTCEKCKLCSGSRGPREARKNIAIIVHGIGAKNFVSLNSIGAAA